MPIRPEMKPLYPYNWGEISLRIRYERAKGVCEFCGAVEGKPNPKTGSIVVLTVAHLDQDPTNCDDENLKALCQKCHLDHDRPFHIRTRKRNRLLADNLLFDVMELVP